ncbi:MAG: homocysteine S-methyltransferase family protein, partial [Nitrospinales bacterium]
MDFKQALQKQVLVLDGAMGTMVQALGLNDAAFGGSLFKMLSDLLIFSRPEALQEIHLQYLKAGASMIETNTFGASVLRLKEFDFTALDVSDMNAFPADLENKRTDYEAFAHRLNIDGCQIARRAVEQYRSLPEYDGRPLFVVGSIGPSNYVVSSTQANLQKTTFRRIVENFQGQVEGLIDGGADVLLFETQQDILELKASIVGAHKAFKEKGKALPIMAQVTVDSFSKMQIFNTDILAAYVAVSRMGIDTFGINCNVGPEEMHATVEKLSGFCNHPISIIPNAGQPISEDGVTVYKLEPEAMADTVETFVKKWGVSIVGGCCGTRPAHIKALREKVEGFQPLSRKKDKRIFISGPQEAVELDSSENLIRIGERLNVRGSKKVRDAVEREGEMESHVLEDVVSEQVNDLGLDIIDICMDSNVVETETVLPRVIHD